MEIVAAPRVYLGVAYLRTSNNYGYPSLNAIGVESKSCPSFKDQPVRPVFYLAQRERIRSPIRRAKFRGVPTAIPDPEIRYRPRAVCKSPVYPNGGSVAINTRRLNTPSARHAGPYLGLGGSSK